MKSRSDLPRIQIPEKMGRFINNPKRYKIVYGGRGSGKSQTIASLCLMDASHGIRTLACREFQNSVDDSVHALLAGQIESLSMKGFQVQNSQILFHGEPCFKFRGLARNPEAIKSMHTGEGGFNRFWVEEAQTISEASLKALTPTLRSEGSEIWMSGNPRSSMDPFSQRFIKPFEEHLNRDGFYEDDLHLIVKMNYTDNKWFPSVLEAERLYDLQNTSRAMYDHIWMGHHLDSVMDAIIEPEWFDAAIDAHVKLGFKAEGVVIAAHDPSDEGGDSKGLAVRHGNVVIDVCEKVTGDSNEGMDWAIDKALQHQADWFVWDSDGLGVSLKRQVDSALAEKKVDYFMFKGSEGVEDPELPYTEGGKERSKVNRETFLNKRAQYWWRLRDRFEATYRAVEKNQYIDPDLLISLSSGIDNLEQLRSEVCRIPLKRNNSGKIQILSKVEMAKKPYQIPSPNMGDALMMAMYRPKTLKKQAIHIDFAGWAQ